MTQGVGSVQSRLHSDTVLDKRQYITDDDLTMTERDLFVSVTLTAANNSAIILPSVVDAMGGVYSIEVASIGTGLVTISDKSDDAGLADRYMSTAGDKLILYSDGLEWNILHENIAVFEIFDDFLSQTQAETDNVWIENSGNDAEAVDPTINVQEGGVILLTTGDADGTTANDGSQIIAHLPMQADSGGLFFEARIHINTAITDVSVFAGLTDVTTLEEAFSNSADTITSNATDACGFLYDTDATTDEWWALAVDTNVDDTGNAATGTAPVADTYQVLRLEVAPDGNTVTFFINGGLVATRSAGGVSPSTNLYATVIACATTTTSKGVDIDYISFGHNR